MGPLTYFCPTCRLWNCGEAEHDPALAHRYQPEARQAAAESHK